MHQVRVVMSPVIIVMIFMFDTVLVIVMSSVLSNICGSDVTRMIEKAEGGQKVFSIVIEVNLKYSLTSDRDFFRLRIRISSRTKIAFLSTWQSENCKLSHCRTMHENLANLEKFRAKSI